MGREFTGDRNDGLLKKGKIMGKVKIIIRALCTALCAAVVVTATGSSWNRARAAQESVADKQQKVNELREANRQRQQQINALDGDISENEAAMALIGDQIDGYLAEIAAYEELVAAKQYAVEIKREEIAEVEQSIADNELEIENKKAKAAELEAENKANLEKFGKLARYMYMNGLTTQMPILNGSDDWYDYFVYSDVVNNIAKQNSDFMNEINASIEQQKQIIEELNREIEELEQRKLDLLDEKAKLEQQEADLESDKVDLEADKDAKQNDLYSLAAQNDEYMAKIAGLKKSIAEAEEQEEALNAQIEEMLRDVQQNRDPDMPDYSGDGLRWPLDPSHKRITTYFGYDGWRGGNHGGIDICDSAIVGAPIYAAQSGYVVTVSNTCTHNEGKEGWTCGCGGNFGNYVVIDHGGSLATLYGHMQAIYVYQGQFVEKGDVIGEVGSTGWSTWWHLHFETRVNGTRVDPLDYVS